MHSLPITLLNQMIVAQNLVGVFPFDTTLHEQVMWEEH